MDKYIGKRLDGRYEIREIIGVGGMAVVYKAFDTIENRIVAIKILKEEFVSNEDFVRRFKNESKAIAVLSHPNIVKVYDVSFGDLIQYIVMEYIEGITLKEYIDTNGSLEWKKSVSIVMQILRALQHAHDKGIIHRDVKPQNIMLTSDGNIKVTDFGIARFARSDYKTMTDKAIGSVHYISPEQARGEITDEKADIYSVGVMLYEMLSGTLPFQADSAVIVAMMQLQNEAKPLREIDPTIPLGLAQITSNAMQKDVVKRYQTAAEMLCDIETFRRDPSATFERNYFVDDAPTKFVGSSSAKETEAPPQKKNSWVPIVTGALVGVVVIAVIILGIVFFNKMNSSSDAIECPNFVGMTVEEIREKYGDDKFTFSQSYEETTDYEVGEVIKQSPDPGVDVKKKNVIRLTIAKAATLIEVPDVSGDTESLARQTLRNSGFTEIVIEKTYDDVVPEDKVIKTDPLNGSQIPGDSEITLYISKGKEVIYTTVPNVLGCDKDSAKAMIENKNLVLGDVTTAKSSEPKGYVISQSVEGDVQVPEDTVINLVISSGDGNTSNSMDITISLPDDCSLDFGYVVARTDSGLNYQSELLNFSSDAGCTFTLKSTAAKDSAVISIVDKDEKYEYEYQKIVINFAANNYEITKHYDNYPKR